MTQHFKFTSVSDVDVIFLTTFSIVIPHHVVGKTHANRQTKKTFRYIIVFLDENIHAAFYDKSMYVSNVVT